MYSLGKRVKEAYSGGCFRCSYTEKNEINYYYLFKNESVKKIQWKYNKF